MASTTSSSTSNGSKPKCHQLPRVFLAPHKGQTQIITPVVVAPLKKSVERPSDRHLNRLRETKGINTFVGKPWFKELVGPQYPIGLLKHFCPALREPLRDMVDERNYIVYLPNLNKGSVSWFLRFAYQGGANEEFSFISNAKTDEILTRLRTVVTLGYPGPIRALLWKKFLSLALNGSLAWADFEWLYQDQPRGTITHCAKLLTERIADAVMYGEMTKELPSSRGNRWFYVSMRHLVTNMVDYIGFLQNREKIAVTPFQLEFIYSFSLPNSRVREVTVRGLARLMDEQYIDAAEGGYIEYSGNREWFQNDMKKAWDDLQAKKKKLAKKEAANGVGRAQPSSHGYMATPMNQALRPNMIQPRSPQTATQSGGPEPPAAEAKAGGRKKQRGKRGGRGRGNGPDGGGKGQTGANGTVNGGV